MTKSQDAILNKTLLKKLYVGLGKTDKEIASFFNLDRTTVVHARKYYGILSGLSTGRIGELAAIQKLKNLGFRVLDMNETNKLSEFDLLVNDEIRVEVKSSKLYQGVYRFVLTEQTEGEKVNLNTRIRLNNGRTKKIFHKTCDLMIFVGIDDLNGYEFWVIPSKELPLKIQTVSVSPKGKYRKYSNCWELFKGGEGIGTSCS